MKLWLDDVRTPPDSSWVWVKAVPEAMVRIYEARRDGEVWEEASLDHDLGEGLDARELLLWLDREDYWPVQKPIIHSMNPPGRIWMERFVQDVYRRLDEGSSGVRRERPGGDGGGS